MSRVSIIILLFLAYLFTIDTRAVDYVQVFGSSYTKAVKLANARKLDIFDELENYKVNKKLLLAVVFPELLRYKYLQDKIETLALKVFFINLGYDYANFSIGLFQMKPSFVIRLENEILQQSKYVQKRFGFLNHIIKDNKEYREQIVERLEIFEWQVKYLAIFYYLVKNKFNKEISNLSLREKVIFFACAYNVGYTKSFRKIMKWKDVAYFPYGKFAASGQRQFIYSDISWNFYQNL